MMERIWLAAILGVVLGLGVAFTPSTGTAGVPKAGMVQPMMGTEGQRNPAASPNPSAASVELVLLGLFAGLLVAAPFFLVARKRVQ
jgi:hypothetical protein